MHHKTGFIWFVYSHCFRSNRFINNQISDLSAKQLSELGYLARIKNKKSIGDNYCNVASKKSAIGPQFRTVSFVLLKISLTFLSNFEPCKIEKFRGLRPDPGFFRKRVYSSSRTAEYARNREETQLAFTEFMSTMKTPEQFPKSAQS